MKTALIFFILAAVVISLSCGGEKDDNRQLSQNPDPAYSPEKDKEIQLYNLNVRKEQAAARAQCDTLAVAEFILNNYPEGTYLVSTDEPQPYETPRYGVIYYSTNYIFALIARSRPGERLIETQNIIGFDESYIDYDSTRLGTAFFYLVLFECTGNDFRIIWESPVPSHGGFNNLILSTWRNNVTRVTLNFYYAHKRGSVDFNYYLLDGLTNPPHLMMTYSGINFRRTEAELNRDKYPDFYEHIFYDLENRIIQGDSVGFVWKQRDSSYISLNNRKQTRPY